MEQDFGIIIIARNEAHCIADCLAAISETIRGRAVVVIDSRTTDNTAEIARGFVQSVFEVDGQRGRLRNSGYRSLGLSYVAFVDADMQLTPGYLETLRHVMDEDPRLAVVTGAQVPISCCLLGVLDCEYQNYRRANPSGGTMYRTAALEDVGGFHDDLNVGEDADLLQRLVQRGWRMRWIGSVTIRHRYAPSVRSWVNKMTHGAGAGFRLRGLMRLIASPAMGVHAAWIRRQPHMLWYVPFRSLVLLGGGGAKRVYHPVPW